MKWHFNYHNYFHILHVLQLANDGGMASRHFGVRERDIYAIPAMPFVCLLLKKNHEKI